MNPKVSVVIAAYNSAAYISRAIASCLRQTMSNLEVVVVDDGSTDNTDEVVRSFRDPRVRLIRLESNHGPAHARNLAIANARGEWIAVLDADDYMHPERLATLLAQASILGNATVLLDLARTVFERQDGTLKEWRIVGNRDRRVRGKKSAIIPVSLVDVVRGKVSGQPLFPRKIVLENGIEHPTSIKYGEDMVFLVRLASVQEVRLYQYLRPMYYYVIRPTSLTAEPGRLGDLEAALKLLVSETSDPSVRSALMERIRQLDIEGRYEKMKRAFLSGNWTRAVHILRQEPKLLKYLLRNMPASLAYRIQALIWGARVR